MVNPDLAIALISLLVTVGIGVVTLIFTVIAARPARRHRLEYHYWRASTLLTLPARSLIDVRVNGKKVKNAWQLTIRFVNSGAMPIRTEDWSSALTVTFPHGVKPISAVVSAVKPTSLSPGARVISNTVEVEPLLLNQGDLFELEIVGDGLGDYRKPLVEARIANLPTFHRARFIYNPGNGPEGAFIREDAVIWGAFAAMGLGVIALLIFGVSGMSVSSKVWAGIAFAISWFGFLPMWLWAANRRRAGWRPTKYL